MKIVVKQTFTLLPITQKEKDKYPNAKGKTIKLIQPDGLNLAWCDGEVEAKQILMSMYPDVDGWEVSEPYA